MSETVDNNILPLEEVKPSFVTTKDNPFDPFDQFEDWNRFDEDHHYFTLSYLSRIALTSHELTEKEYIRAVNDAVDEIVEMNITGNYVKVVNE